MQGATDLSVPPKCPARVSHPLRGMALGTLAEIAVRLVISGYIFAVVVYVNASGNWDKDDDLGTRGTNRSHERSRLTTSLTRASDTFERVPKLPVILTGDQFSRFFPQQGGYKRDCRYIFPLLSNHFLICSGTFSSRLQPRKFVKVTSI